ncbi:hypothetical protein PM10SUCC1_09180 [Propionigenium maris DSM 9537]|uniref:RloB-like protein n=1 Tax=Propionigenium maris DSM 9537 TaxID=1123000 RepID=A0A9W6GHN4_9FUSO|nr:hypothetical protein [Propionigenium maris]GLI55404.1 hypothetical protein PM10SUCC1_09180 [Propionigenium maris DSM 9537]
MNFKAYPIIYYVEGENEEKLVNSIKNNMIVSGRVQKFNVCNKMIKSQNLMKLKKDTIIILVFDIDLVLQNKKNARTNLEKNIAMLSKHKKVVKKIILVPQDENLEDELIRATKLKKIQEMFKVKSIDEHKEKLNKCNNLGVKLKEVGFDIKNLWKSDKINQFDLSNESELIKL